MFTDYVMNGVGHGSLGSLFNEIRFDVGLLRPYLKTVGGRNVPFVTVNTGRYKEHGGKKITIYREVPVEWLERQGVRSPVFNATSLRKEEYIQLDQVVLKAARQRLRAWTDLAAASSYGGFNAMGKMTLEYEAMSDPGEAVVDMDGLTSGRNDMPLFSLRSLPLPITHSDFHLGLRKLSVSRNGNTPLDMTQAEAHGRRVGELVEDQVIGNVTGINYGGVTSGVTQNTTSTLNSQVYGYTNFGDRLTKTNFTAPSGAAWTPNDTYNEVLTAINQLANQFFYGPFMVYHSTDWSPYMSRVFSVSGGNNNGETLLTMLKKIPEVQDVRRLDRLTSTFTLLLVQMTSDVAQAVDGMGITTFQWESKGGWQQNFMVATISVPRLQSDYNSRTGILHGTTA